MCLFRKKSKFYIEQKVSHNLIRFLNNLIPPSLVVFDPYNTYLELEALRIGETLKIDPFKQRN